MFVLGPASLIPLKAQDDLIYVAVNPCRIVDTREAGGAITANDFRNFLVSGSLGELAVQGGKTDCLDPKAGTGQKPLVISAYIVAVPATSSTGGGVLTAYPSDQLPPPVGTGSTVNFAEGQIIGNTTNATLCDPASCPIDGEFAVLARNTDEHVVIDVQGYFYPVSIPAPVETGPLEIFVAERVVLGDNQPVWEATVRIEQGELGRSKYAAVEFVAVGVWEGTSSNLIVNGREYVLPISEPLWIADIPLRGKTVIPIPVGVLRSGDNTIRIESGPINNPTNAYDDFFVANIVLVLSR